MNKKAIARTAAIFISVIVILAAALIGTIAYFMTRPEAVTPPPGEFQFTNLTVSPSSVPKGGSVTVSVNVTNTAGVEITGTITLLLNDVREAEKTITLAGGNSTIVTFNVAKDPGDYEATMAGTTLTPVTFTVAEAAPSFVTANKLVYESGATYQWYDPHVSYYQYDWWTLWHSVETLVWYEKANATKIIPWLAESYTRSSDGLHYDFTLRQGITFQDGTPFNATAVWFSFNRMLVMDGTSQTGVHGSQAAWMIQQLINETLAYGLSGKKSLGYLTDWNATFVQAVLDENFVEILGEYKVRLNLLTATTQFDVIMACPFAAIISPISTIEMDYEYGGWGTWNGNYTTYFLHMAGNGDTGLNLPEDGWKVGTGAYYVDSVDATTYKVVLKAYADYWGGPNDINLPPAGKTRIETIEYVYQPSFATRLLDLKAGTATAIQVPEANVFQVVDRDKWIDDGILDSIVSGATVHGVFPTFNTWWLDFNTNVTTAGGGLKDWQPFADWRLRMAASCAVNMTYMNIYVNNRLSILANNIVPPGTVPAGSYNPDVKPTFSFNLTRAEELLNDTRDNPLTSFTYYNGTTVPAGLIDNSFGPDFVHGKVVELYVQSGATTFIEVLTTMTDNLNAIAKRLDMGIRFNVVIVPGGQQYTLASAHMIDSYMGGWICDYNHVMNWLQPMYLSTGTYMSWNLWNITALDDLYDDAVIADREGNVTRLLEINDEMNTLANEILIYMVWWHDTEYFTRSTWLKGWFLNTNYGVDLWSTMYYEEP
jgi:ABC-type transport system substrate-binding protein